MSSPLRKHYEVKLAFEMNYLTSPSPKPYNAAIWNPGYEVPSSILNAVPETKEALREIHNSFIYHRDQSSSEPLHSCKLFDGQFYSSIYIR